MLGLWLQYLLYGGFVKYINLALSVVLFSGAAAHASVNTIKIQLFTAPEWCWGCRVQEAAIPTATPVSVPYPAGQVAQCVRVEFDVRSLNSRDAQGNETQDDEINGALLESSIGSSRACTVGGGRVIPCNQLVVAGRLIDEHTAFTQRSEFNAWVAEQLRLNRVDVQTRRCPSAP